MIICYDKVSHKEVFNVKLFEANNCQSASKMKKVVTIATESRYLYIYK